jgi:1-acyl-sn-glycerol-3-phosphate acyltransferase
MKLRKILTPFKFLLVFIEIVVFLAMAAAIRFFIRDSYRRTYVGSVVLMWMSRFSCRCIFNIRVNPIGFEKLRDQGSVLLAGNHMSYIDVIVIGSQLPACFVTSVEIKETPGLGLICRMAGCLFVERRSRQDLHREIGELRDGLEHDLTVAIFPEATSTNAEKILRFRRALFLSAIQAKRPVVPMCLNYRRLSGEPVSVANRDRICWYGSMPFLSHLWAVCGHSSIDADLTFLPAIHPALDAEPGVIALQAQTAVESVFRPIVTISESH